MILSLIKGCEVKKYLSLLSLLFIFGCSSDSKTQEQPQSKADIFEDFIYTDCPYNLKSIPI
jgi:hypothetical protein